MTDNALYSEYKPTRRERFKRWLGFRQPHVSRPDHDFWALSKTVIHLGWRNRLLLLFGGSLIVQVVNETSEAGIFEHWVVRSDVGVIWRDPRAR
jgi:hypothetical protein